MTEVTRDWTFFLNPPLVCPPPTPFKRIIISSPNKVGEKRQSGAMFLSKKATKGKGLTLDSQIWSLKYSNHLASPLPPHESR